MNFRKYNKIHRLGKEETQGILEGVCYIQEKVDGANSSVWLQDGALHKGSRSQDVSQHPTWKGLCDHIDAQGGIKKFFDDNGERFTLYGEWLVRHTISYKELAYRNFYLYDIWDSVDNTYLDIDKVYEIAKQYSINVVPLRAKITNPTEEQIKKFCGVSDYGDKGEGVVIKNLLFKNKFGDIEYAKIVTDEFKEDNGITFGGNNKHSDTYHEVYVMNKYCTLERVKKIIHKAESMIDEKLDMKHIPMIMGMVYHDLLAEEIWEIQKKIPKVDFKNLQRCISKKTKQIYVELLTGDVSVAHQNKIEQNG